MKYNTKGGSSNGRQPKVVNNQVYGFEEGSNPRQAALNYQKNMNADQNNLNHVGGNGKMPKKTKNDSRKSKSKGKKQDGKYTKRSIRIKLEQGKKKGGSGSGRSTTVEVPQFSTPGPKVSPLDANSASVKGNESALQAQANAVGDCYATNSCGTKGGTRRRGGRHIGGTRRGGRRRGGRRRGGTRRRGGRRRGGTSLVRNKWGCMSGGNEKCEAEIKDLIKKAEKMSNYLDNLNIELNGDENIINPEFSEKSMQIETETKIKNILDDKSGGGSMCTTHEQKKRKDDLVEVIKDLKSHIDTAESLIEVNKKEENL